jgi:hypothetical protein
MKMLKRVEKLVETVDGVVVTGLWVLTVLVKWLLG